MLMRVEKIIDYLKEANTAAIAMISEGRNQEAVTQLEEATSALEYLANLGKIIDRNMIIVTMYNLACAYQG